MFGNVKVRYEISQGELYSSSMPERYWSELYRLVRRRVVQPKGDGAVRLDAGFDARASL